MKKNNNILMSLFAVAALLTAGRLHAQEAPKSSFGIYLSGFDYAGPASDKYLFHDKEEMNEDGVMDTKKVLLWRPGIRVSYYRTLNRFLELGLGASFTRVEIPGENEDSAYIDRLLYDDEARKSLYLSFDARLQYYILQKHKYVVSPYLFAGISPTLIDDGFGLTYLSGTIPVGAGFNFNVGNEVHLQLESAYHIDAFNNARKHLQHSVGIVFGFTRPKAAPVADAPPLPQADSDNDGVPDNTDACPSIAGPAQFNGCPDSDNDGISDRDDQCPLVAGTAQFNGCPDSDGDGVNDKDDKCPYEPGTADRQGCPVPDKDGDGFPDDEDRCPDRYSKTNDGCPEISREVIEKVEKAAKAIFFETGKAAIKKASYKQLDAVVSVLNGDNSLYADIEGHTDNVGTDERNMELSKQRANAVRDYFISKGIAASRLGAEGFGETQPVADNGTSAGRAQNRRTVIKLRNFQR